MTNIQHYLNPFCRSQAQGAGYGWHALTHLTEKASKIQNVALRSMALVFAFLVDATVGFGLVSSLSYNSGALLYNSYGKVKHFIQKYRGMEESPWNKTALKTWAFIGTTSALVATLYYFGAFGSMKQGIGASQLFSSTSSSVQIFSTLPTTSNLPKEVRSFLSVVGYSFACVSGTLFTGIIARVGYLYYCLPRYDSKMALGKFLEPEKVKVEDILNKSWFGVGDIEPWVYHFSNGTVRFLSSYVNQCRNTFLAELKSRKVELTDKEDFWPKDINHAVIQSANEWMRASYILSRLVLEDFETYATRAKVPIDEIMGNSDNAKKFPPLHFCFRALRQYLLLRALGSNETFYGNAAQNSWRKNQNGLIASLLKKSGMSKLIAKDRVLAVLTTKDESKAAFEQQIHALDLKAIKLPELPKSSFSDWFFSRGPWAEV